VKWMLLVLSLGQLLAFGSFVPFSDGRMRYFATLLFLVEEAGLDLASVGHRSLALGGSRTCWRGFGFCKPRKEERQRGDDCSQQ
jgi:hypothetical protein